MTCKNDLLEEPTSSVAKISENDLDVLRQFDLDMTFGPCTGEFVFNKD